MPQAQTLPIGFIPEQPLIPAMRNYVVNQYGCLVASLGLAHNAEWIATEKSLRCLLPLVVVSPLVGCAAHLVIVGMNALKMGLRRGRHLLDDGFAIERAGRQNNGIGEIPQTVSMPLQ